MIKAFLFWIEMVVDTLVIRFRINYPLSFFILHLLNVWIGVVRLAIDDSMYFWKSWVIILDNINFLVELIFLRTALLSYHFLGTSVDTSIELSILSQTL